MSDSKSKLVEELKSRKTDEFKKVSSIWSKEKNPNLNNVEEYCKIINDIIHINSSSPGAGGPQSAGIILFTRK